MSDKKMLEAEEEKLRELLSIAFNRDNDAKLKWEWLVENIYVNDIRGSFTSMVRCAFSRHLNHSIECIRDVERQIKELDQKTENEHVRQMNRKQFNDLIDGSRPQICKAMQIDPYSFYEVIFKTRKII